MTSSGIPRLAELTCIAALVLSRGLPAQSTAAFEVASIRRNVGGGIDTRLDISGGRFSATNASLKTLIRNAWNLLSFQLAGGPAWLDSDMYDIVATTGGSEQISPDQLKLLLQNLLTNRFRLKFHREARENQIYALVVARDGAKLSQGSDAEEPGINTSRFSGKVRMKGTREPVSILASNLGNQLGRFVVDRTGLPGVYDWSLEWDPDQNADSTFPSLFAALPQQLGLRLEPQKGPVETLVIDSAEKASDN